MTESFTYDHLNRLTEIWLGNIKTGWFDYDPYGRMIRKTADNRPVFASAVYNITAKPHAIDAAKVWSDVFPNDDMDITYTAFDKVKTLAEGSNTLAYTYGYDRQRIFMEEHANGIVRTKRYVGGCEFVTLTENNTTTEKTLTYLSSPIGIFAVVETVGNDENLHYILKDHLGSWTTITDCQGNIEQELSFDAWGNRRNPETWHSYSQLPEPMFDRGFTGHEHLYAFGLINMNGRMYDPLMSSFLSVDAYVQSPDNSQNFNRYAYCLNNPLKYVDPTGWRMEGGYMGNTTQGPSGWGKNLYPVYEPRDFTNPINLWNMSLSGGINGPWGANLIDGGGSVGLTNSYGYQVTHYANSVYNYCSSFAQLQLIQNWRENPCIGTNRDLYEAGIRNLTVGEAYFGNGMRSSFINWTVSGIAHAAQIPNEFVGGKEYGCVINSNCPLWMYDDSNPKIAAGLINTFGLYASIEAGLHYNEGLGFWQGKNGKFYPMCFNGNEFTGGKLKYAQALSNKFKVAGSIIGYTGALISFVQLMNATTDEDKLLYGFDMMIGTAGAACPSYFGIPSMIWFFGGKQVSIWYGEKVITPMIEEGLNPGLMIYQPFK